MKKNDATKSSFNNTSEDFQALMTLIKENKWHDIECHLHSEKIAQLSKQELSLVLYGIVLIACQEISCDTSLVIPARYLAAFELLLNCGADVNIITPQSSCILASSAKSVLPELTHFFLERQADPNISTSFGTPIIILCNQVANVIRSGDFPEKEIEEFKLRALKSATHLLKKGADPNISYKKGAVCLIPAIDTGWTELVKLLLDQGADIPKDQTTQRYAMENAIKYTSPEMLSLLLEHGLPTDITLEKKLTPVLYAQKYGKPGTVEVLKNTQSTRAVKNVSSNDGLKNSTNSNPLKNILTGSYTIDIDATIKHHVDLVQKNHGQQSKEFQNETRKVWEKNSRRLAAIEMLITESHFIMKNSEEEETYSFIIKSKTLPIVIYIDGFCSHDISVKRTDDNLYFFEADDCQLSDAVWRKKI